MRTMDLGTLPPLFNQFYGQWITNRDGSMSYDRKLPVITTKLLGYCLFPEDADARKYYAVDFGAMVLGKTELIQQSHSASNYGYASLTALEKQALDKAYPYYKRETEKYYFEEFGGYKTLYEGSIAGLNRRLYADREKNSLAFTWAGAMLLTMVSLDHFHSQVLRKGPSIRKVARLFEATGGPARSALMKMWSEFKSVAHLGAACIYMGQAFQDSRFSDDRDERLFEGVMYRTPEFLCIARELQEFANCYVPPHSQQGPLVNPDLTWRLPDAVPLIKDIVHKQPMPASDLAVLSEIRSSKN